MSIDLDNTRLDLIEVATTRLNDIKRFYDKYLGYENGCSILALDAPRNVPVLFRGKLRHYDAKLVPFILAGVDHNAPKICENDKCLNPAHVI